MNQKPDMVGLASLIASRGRNGDSVLVHMTPEEVGGLQALAMAHGGSLSVNPDTKLPEANFLKAILPAIAGSTLKTLFPKLGSATTGLIVGAATGLIDKSFDKGLRSGLSAYSGAKTMEGLAAARKAVQAGSIVPRVTTERGEELSAKRLMDKAPIDVSKLVVETPQVQTVTKAPSLFGEMGEGLRALFKPEGQEAFLGAVEGPYKRQGLKDLSRSAYFAGLANLAATEPKKIKPGAGSSGARFYVPGEVNPLYGQGYDQWYFKPGYFSDKYPGYADGGEVMVSPQAVLPQQVSVYNPSFTQDREGLKNYYESLLVPPDTTPRDTSELQRYLDELNARLRRPYQPVGGYEYGALPAPGTGGGGGGAGGTVTPPGVDPFATGVTGTPIEFLTPSAKPEPTAPREDLTPPSTIARPAMPSDLGDLFTVPTTINMPAGAVSVLPLEQEVIPDVTEEEMISADALGDLFKVPTTINVPKGDVSVIPLEQEVIPEVTEEEMITADSLGNLFTVPTTINMPAGAVSVLPLDELIVPDVTEEEMISADALGDLFKKPMPIAAIGAGGLEPIVSEPEEDTSSVEVQTVDDSGKPMTIPVSVGGMGADVSGAGGLKPIVSDPGKAASYSVRELSPEQQAALEERMAADALQQKLFTDLGGVGQPGFAQAQTTQEVADASQPIVDEILKNFEEQQEAEKKEAIDKAKEIGMGIAGQALRSMFPAAGVIYDIYKEVKDKRDAEAAAKKGVISIDTRTEEQIAEDVAKVEAEIKAKAEAEAKAKAEAEAKAKAEAEAAEKAKSRTGGGGAYPMLPSLSQERFGLTKAMGDDVFGTPTTTLYDPLTGEIIPENVDLDKGMAAGGPVRYFAAGGLGSLQQYAVGGKLVNGAGDGMSDDIKANISGVQEARLADGEFVIPADVVSHLGNGSTDAGAKQLYAMMDRIRKARTGRTRQAPEVEASKYMPA